MFKRPSNAYGKSPEPQTPYQRAAQVWDDRIGSARVQARNWRLMAFGSLILSAGLAAGLIWQSSRGTIVPWIVQVDHLGAPQVMGPALTPTQPNDPQIAYQLAEFITNVRSIPADAVIVRQNWLRAYEFTTDRGAQALNGYAQANDPFAKVGTEQVSVEIASVIRASPDSFRISWIERHYHSGQLINTERWSAIVSLMIDPPRDADDLRKNPLGIYVNALNWSKELSP
jgi:type IV secretion system protein VirB5